MKIINCGRGIHSREITGIAKLQSLPSCWSAYTNLDLAMSPGKSREIDVIMIVDDRIFLIDLKDWGGRIESKDGHWLHNGHDNGPSPVGKIHQNAKDISFLLKTHIQKNAKRHKFDTPKIHGLVVVTANPDLHGVATTEIANVFSIEKFVEAVATPESRMKVFGRVFRTFIDHPLTSPDWKHQLSRFFNVQTGIFKPGKRSYGGFTATSDTAVFEHPAKIYSEYDAVDEKSAKTFGTLRVWDFTKAGTRFQNEDGRAEIVGRERDIIAYLQDRSEKCEFAILQPKAEDLDRGVNYWEVYDRRRRMKRLVDFAATEVAELGRDGKIELARQLLSTMHALHLVDAAHLDVGGHSVWLQQPSTVRLSHLMAASYPQVQSLGDMRYHFLSSARVPEDVLGEVSSAKRKDVFLLGSSVHHLIFGHPPRADTDGMPPEWSASVDVLGAYMDLHPWFEAALALVPSDRFADAGTALDAFNAAVAAKPSMKEVIEGIERFQKSIRSQMQLFSALPPLDTLRDDAHKSIWRSEQDGRPVFVKMWKRVSWGDQNREGPRILDFLTRARNLQRSPLPDCPTITDVMWLGDAIVLVQNWIEAPTLAAMIQAEPAIWSQSLEVLAFLKTLTERVMALHDLRMAHGDLKPQNILVTDVDARRPVFVDVIDFSAADDGEIRSNIYAPSEGGRYERDRYAVTKIAEDLLGTCDLDPRLAAILEEAIIKCRTSIPLNGTLLPFLEALDCTLTPTAAEERLSVRLSIRHSKTGQVLADEGLFYLRRAPDRSSLFIRGACEEIEIEFNDKGEAFRGRRKPLDQKFISMVSKYEFMSLPMEIDVVGSDINNFEALEELFESSEFIAGWERLEGAPISRDADDEGDESEDFVSDAFGDSAEDTLIEAILGEPPTADHPDVTSLWRQLIDAESELTTEGIAANESSYRREINRVVVPFELECGTFDFNRDDRVLVERLDRKGQWRQIGHLDIARSVPDFLLIDIRRFSMPSYGRIVEKDQRLRFTSHWEKTSLKRRDNAISRILSRQSRVLDLIDVFDPRSGKAPIVQQNDIDPAALEDAYGLNNAQAAALAALLGVRPVGLVQGPPGTGKTVFIAALVHYTITHSLVQNVLLASQSHEAVNNAAEAVLKLFAKNGERPSILRVGHEGVVSDCLLPFHAARVEQLYKDRFQASMKDRLRIGGRTLGLGDSLIEDIVFIEMAIYPVAKKITELEKGDEPDKQKIASLRATIEGQLHAINLENTALDKLAGDDIVDALVELARGRQRRSDRASPDKIARLRALAALARDFVGSVSTERRSFETFLAGTRQIVTGTCVGLGKSSLGLTATPFDLVIVDEAARCTASELSVPIQAGRWVVLVGDHAQLEPQHKPALVAQVAVEVKTTKREVLRSDFERTFETPYGAVAGRRLTKQYRMLPPIGRLVSSSFYNDMLEHGRTEMEINPAALPSDLCRALLWVETDSFGDQGLQQSEQNGTSLINPIEVSLIMALLKRWGDCEAFGQWLETRTAHTRPIGIICTYAAQRDLLRKKLQLTNLSMQLKSAIKIDTVDSYQGKENLIVILSLVRNNADGPQEDGVTTIQDGFLSRPNRINVAVSRAMDRLVIVGAKGRWRSDSPMARIAEAFDREIACDEATIAEGLHLLNHSTVPAAAHRQVKTSTIAEGA